MTSLRILLVDDDIIERKSIQRAIDTSSSNHAVTEVHSAEEALSVLSNIRFDVILMDYHLPGMSGIEAILQLAGKMPMRYAPIVMVSNNPDHELAEKCINAGAQDFILKADVTPDRIRRAIQQSCQRHAKEQKMMTSYEQVKVLSERDRLTGLHNRHYFNKSLGQRLQLAMSSKSLVAILLMDLNKFKQVNDNLGHHVGDKLLVSASRRFTSVFRENELCARLGGDEFVFVAEHLSCADEAIHIAKRLCDTFSTPFSIDDHNIQCGCSVGIALAPVHSLDPQTLLRFADMAMYQAKNHPEQNFCLFEPERLASLSHDSAARLSLSSAVVSPDSHFDLMYHPVINTQTNRIWGFHCKIHLRHEYNEYDSTVTPEHLRDIAAQQNCIRPLGFWQFRSALAELSQWQASQKPQNDSVANASPIWVTFEVNSLQLSDPDFFAFVELTIHKYNIAPSCVIFAVTENMLTQADEVIKECIETLANMGVKLAVIDFGLGASSLTMLLRYPIFLVELAPVVIQQATNDISPYRKLLNHIQEFMNNLGIAVAVRGVSTKQELALCNSLGFSLLQGADNLPGLNANEALNALHCPYSMDKSLRPTLLDSI